MNYLKKNMYMYVYLPTVLYNGVSGAEGSGLCDRPQRPALRDGRPVDQGKALQDIWHQQGKTRSLNASREHIK